MFTIVNYLTKNLKDWFNQKEKSEKYEIRYTESTDIVDMSLIHNAQYTEKGSQFNLDFYIQQVGLFPDLNFVACVCESSNKVVGYILACIDDGHGHITDFTISENHRNKMLGKRLMAATLVEMTEKGLKYCKLHVDCSNEAALHVYRDVFAFFIEDTIINYYGDGNNAYLMSKRLDRVDL